MEPNLPTVSVIIPARDAADVLPRALEAIAGQSYPNIVDVVVAAADDPTAEAADRALYVSRHIRKQNSSQNSGTPAQEI